MVRPISRRDYRGVMASRKRSSQVVSRATIINAAVEEVLAEGILGLRVHEVAKRAGVSVPLIYKYFTDRNGLLAETLGFIFEQRSFEHLTRVQQVFDSLDQPTVDDFVLLLVLPSQDFRRVRRWLNIQIFAASVEIPALREKMIEVEKHMHAEIVKYVIMMNERLGQQLTFTPRGVAVLTRVIQLGMAHNDLLDDEGAIDDDFRDIWRMILAPALAQLREPS